MVRTAAPVAVRIPTHPAVADNAAPTRKLIPTRSGLPGKNATRMTNTTATKIARTLYSVFRNAMAPLLMSAAICCMRSEPASRRLMLRTSTNAKIAAAIGAPNPNTK